MPLPDDTRLGYVHLTVSNLTRSITFYEQVLGLKLHRKSGNSAYLGAGESDVLVLTGIPGALHYPRHSGLYHFAILVPTRRDLGDFLRSLVGTGTKIQGFADHLVSEAIYLSDPDGNGIEVYRDRPRQEWQYQDGKIKMATDPFDFDGVIAHSPEEEDWQGLPEITVLGHMHLHVGNLEAASDFYRDVIGFEIMNADFPSARFLSAGGYHHHLGINTWNGVGAPPAPANAVGLRFFTVNLPDQASLAELQSRITSAGFESQQKEDGILIKDPSGNGILFAVSG